MDSEDRHEKRYWTRTEIVEFFELSEQFLAELEDEEIICPTCGASDAAEVFSGSDLERVRVARLLVEELGVNVAGVDIILRMRQLVVDMRRQFDAILEEVAGDLEMRVGAAKRPSSSA